MQISFNSPIDPRNIEGTNGYGYATDRMLSSLENLGHEVSHNDGTAEVGFCFNQPQHWKFYGDQYKIGYHPWESTLLKPGWAELMNQCDEIWTPSPIIAEWYTKYAGVTVPVYVYEHGVDPVWAPVPRRVDDTFNFLHVGAEAARKGAREVMGGFRRAFPKNKGEVQLNMKIISKGWQIGSIRNINILNESISLTELVQLYHDNHAYVYPSWGEGFGLTPLQAMATGMPTITVPEWAPYQQFLDPNLTIGSTFSRSMWPQLHPGNMLKPNEDDVIDRMRWVYNNYSEASRFAQGNVKAVTQYYNWDRLTDEAFSALETRLK